MCLASLSAVGLMEYMIYHHSNMTGYFPRGINPIYVRSVSDCAGMCNSDTECRGIYHSKNLQKCILDSNGNITEFEEDNLASYYTRNGTLMLCENQP